MLKGRFSVAAAAVRLAIRAMAVAILLLLIILLGQPDPVAAAGQDREQEELMELTPKVQAVAELAFLAKGQVGELLLLLLLVKARAVLGEQMDW
jgi:hypothetical protein